MSRVSGCAPLARRLACVLALLVGMAASAPQAVADETLLGATIDGLLAELDTRNPSIAAADFATRAAAEGVTIAGAWPDPEISVSLEDLDRERGGVLPTRLGSIYYEAEQTIPLWGKPEVRQDIARAGVVRSEHDRAALRDALAERLKRAFADYYHAHQIQDLLDESATLIDTVVRAAEARYEQGLGAQADIIAAEAERVAIVSAMIDRERDIRRAGTAINALIGRPVEAPLAEPLGLWPVSDAGTIALTTLIERARASNPLLGADAALISAAEGERRLVEKSWYPDVTIGFSVVDQDRDIAGYEARIGLSVPLQWGLREAQATQAAATLASARASREATLLGIEDEIADVYWSLEAEQRRNALLRDTYLPESELGFETMLAGFEVGDTDLADVLMALRRLVDARLQLLETEVEQRRLAATLERLTGDAP